MESGVGGRGSEGGIISLTFDIFGFGMLRNNIKKRQFSWPMDFKIVFGVS